MKFYRGYVLNIPSTNQLQMHKKNATELYSSYKYIWCGICRNTVAILGDCFKEQSGAERTIKQGIYDIDISEQYIFTLSDYIFILFILL